MPMSAWVSTSDTATRSSKVSSCRDGREDRARVGLGEFERDPESDLRLALELAEVDHVDSSALVW